MMSFTENTQKEFKRKPIHIRESMEKRMYCMFVHEGGDDNGGLWCEFPDLPGCMTDGDNLEDLMKNAADVLDSWLDATIAHGNVLPTPSNAETLKAKATACEEPVLFIVPVISYRPSATVRINITGPKDKIAEITAYAKEIDHTRSELMVEATLDYIRANR